MVDNASRDDTIAEVARRGVRLIANPANRGFAAAVNQGFAVLNCTYVLLLNPDAVIQTSLEPLREACDLPGSAGAGGRLVDANGQPQIGFMVRRLPTAGGPDFGSSLAKSDCGRAIRSIGDIAAWIGMVPHDSQVEQPAGAFLMVRREVWEELGGFDESFFPLWFEDVDFCRRIRDRGYQFVLRSGSCCETHRWAFDPAAWQ